MAKTVDSGRALASQITKYYTQWTYLLLNTKYEFEYSFIIFSYCIYSTDAVVNTHVNILLTLLVTGIITSENYTEKLYKYTY